MTHGSGNRKLTPVCRPGTFLARRFKGGRAPADRVPEERPKIVKMALTLAAAAAYMIASSAVPAHDGEFPYQTVRIIVPTAPGGSAGIVARIIGHKLSEAARQQVLVEHHAGALGGAGAQRVARAPADGYTLLLATNSLLVKSALFDRLSFDVVRDFEPVSLVAAAPFVLVLHPSLPVASVEDLIRYAKIRPGELNYASGLRGANLHVAAELFKNLAGVDFVRVPYRLGGAALAGLIRGDTEVGFLPVIVTSPHISAGRLQALAVTAAERLAALPNVPTMIEAGMPGYDYSSWYGLLMPAGTPDARIAAMNGHLRNAVSQSDIAARLAGLGADIIVSSSEDFDMHLRAELARWVRAVEEGALR